ncbi:MAG: F0F1 ATP synthase subunit delta, partial [Nitrospinota bacterium]
MKENIVARRYAKAITGVVREKASLNKVITDLHNISNVIERSDELKNVFYNPSIRMKFKEGVLSQLINRLNPVPPINNLLYLILRKDRIKYLGKIIFVLEELSDQLLNRG